MIKKITIKNIATYNHEGVSIDNLAKVNFIYGANGSGKTTISNVLNSSGLFQDQGCGVLWENDIPLTVITYNRNFREQHFNAGKIPGVFSLGSATKEQIEEIDKLMVNRLAVQEEGLKKKTTIDNQKRAKTESINAFQEDCWTGIYKRYEFLFNPAFDGCKSKERFKNKLLSEFNIGKQLVKPIEELQEKSKVIFGVSPQVKNEISILDFRKLIEVENNTIWQKKIIGKSDVEIAKLIQRLNLNDWVNQGRQYIEGGSGICPFCQKKTIDDSFKTQLEAYFDETFILDVKSIKELSAEYTILAQSILNILQEIEANENKDKSTKLDLQQFTGQIKTLNQQIISNNILISNKLKEPSRSIELIPLREQLDIISALINQANIEIIEHNKIVANFQTEKENLVSDVWKYLIEENRTKIEAFEKQQTGLQAGLDKLEKERGVLRDKFITLDALIKEKNKNITSVQPAVDAINDILSSYGFDNFKIMPSQSTPNHYQIERKDGTIADKTLSEGEVTFITFLYFLQLAKGGLSEHSVSEDRVLVVDDPISSLDSTVLFVVSSLLKEVIKSIRSNNNALNIKQLILLTHNVYFHKEVSFIDGRTKQTNDVKFWILRKVESQTTIQPFGVKNPIRGSYELLWDELKIREQLSGISIQNTMRRIIETYFHTMGKYTNDSLITSFDNKQEQEICRSLICWINDGSHCISDDLHIETQEAINDKFFDVFHKIFINTNHIEHYNMMMNITTDEQA